MMHMELLLTLMSRPHVYQGRVSAASSWYNEGGWIGATAQRKSRRKMQNAKKIQGLRFVSARARYQSGRRCNDGKDNTTTHDRLLLAYGAKKVRSRKMIMMEQLHET